MNLKFCTYVYAWFLELGVSKLSNRFSDAFLFNNQAAQRNVMMELKHFEFLEIDLPVSYEDF